MKITIQVLVTCFNLLIATVVLAVPVTFQVDMSGAPGFLPADTVDVRGTFNSWAGGDSGGTYLVATANPYILTNTVDIAGTPGTNHYYKFNWNYNFELQGLGDRPFTLEAAAQTLPLVYFSDMPPAVSATTNSITFRVSLATQVTVGNFDPTNDTVSVAGTFQSPAQWTVGLVQLTNTGGYLYIGTCTNDGNYPGTYEEFKFIITRGGIDYWESRNNRSFILTNNDVLPVVAFNDIGNAAGVTFQVDLSVQADAGRFTNATDLVECKGSFNGWQGGFFLTNDLAAPNPNLFTGTSWVYDSPGSTVEYKFTVNGGYNRLGWESPLSAATLNRTFVQSNANQVLPPVLWSDWTTNDVLPADTWVQFSVNMTNAVAISYDGFGNIISNSFVDGVDIVYLNGDWMPWWNWEFYPATGLQLTNVPGTLVFTNSVLFNKGSSVPITYKYSINGFDNEAAFSTNVLRFIRATNKYTLPMDTFGLEPHEESFGDLRVDALTGGAVKVSWLGRPGVHLQSATNLAVINGWSASGYSAPATNSTHSITIASPAAGEFFRLKQ